MSSREIVLTGHLSAQNFSFGDEIIAYDGKLNFYVQAEFDVDKAFGTDVLTDRNDDWLNIYANYDLERAGYIQRQQRYRENSSRTSNLYVIIEGKSKPPA